MTKSKRAGRWHRALPLLAGVPIAALAAGTQSLAPVVVKADSHALVGVADSATEGTVTAEQLAQRPLLRPAEVMEAVPGLIVTQHSGDGKANQYFLRGFNLDHGSDFATSLLGMPVNMASHAHGQGYMDLNFLIPELVSGVAYRKGPYAVEDGDFATTGAAYIDYLRVLPRPFASVEIGANRYRRGLLAGSHDDGERGRWLGALELAGNDGPWDQPEGLRKHNGVLRWSQGGRQNGLAVTAMGYDAQWNATEHVPERAILNGEIGRYGALLPTDGGRTQRASLSAEWARPEADGQSRADVYVLRYALHLFSNPSGFISGPQGDQHEQADQRVTGAATGSAASTWAAPGATANGPGAPSCARTASTRWACTAPRRASAPARSGRTACCKPMAPGSPRCARRGCRGCAAPWACGRTGCRPASRRWPAPSTPTTAAAPAAR